MIASLRESKANLSKLVERAAAGEEVLITVRGRPKARLVAAQKVRMNGWAEELKALHRGQAGTADKATSVIEDLRNERWE